MKSILIFSLLIILGCSEERHGYDFIKCVENCDSLSITLNDLGDTTGVFTYHKGETFGKFIEFKKNGDTIYGYIAKHGHYTKVSKSPNGSDATVWLFYIKRNVGRDLAEAFRFKDMRIIKSKSMGLNIKELESGKFLISGIQEDNPQYISFDSQLMLHELSKLTRKLLLDTTNFTWLDTIITTYRVDTTLSTIEVKPLQYPFSLDRLDLDISPDIWKP